MRVAMVSIGTRGDAQPFVVLADELVRRGHQVVLGLSPNLVDFAARAGLEAKPIGPDILAFLESDQGRTLSASGNARQLVDRMMQFLHEHASTMDSQIRGLCESADVIVASALTEDSAACVAEASAVPFAALHPFPWRRTRAVPVPVMTTRSLPPMFNLATWWLIERLWWRSRRSDINRLRIELGLAPTTRSTPARTAATGALAVQAYHRAVVPGLGYGPSTPVVGFLTPTADLRARLGDAGIDADLNSWLDAGEAPVYFGFGSMPVVDPAATLRTIRTVADRCGVRAIVGAGWSRFDLDDSDDRVKVIGAVDHDALLPRCRVAVHHGGAGTTAAAVIAGIPAVVCSVLADQPFWGSRLQRLGVGTHLRFADVNAESLEAALRPTLGQSHASRARALAGTVNADPAAAVLAADRLERHWESSAATPGRANADLPKERTP